jgi:hypothetical protein
MPYPLSYMRLGLLRPPNEVGMFVSVPEFNVNR